MKEKNEYDDGNIPGIDLPTSNEEQPYKSKMPLQSQNATNVIPDEVPRRDGPGGGGMQQLADE